MTAGMEAQVGLGRNAESIYRRDRIPPSGCVSHKNRCRLCPVSGRRGYPNAGTAVCFYM
jgi:hypothetical protein